MSRRALAAGAIKRAATLRAKLGYAPDAALCPFDVAERIGVEVHFLAAPSLEGMYAANRGAIVVNALRPAGRRRYTCGHELGHHAHGHGTSFDGEDELAADRVEEFVVNHFARALLMPKLAVASAFARRGWEPRAATEAQTFVVSQDLGVGFTTLLDHMCASLDLIDRASATRIAKVRLPKVRELFVPGGVEHDLVPVDARWGTRPLDLEVGDVVVGASLRFEGVCAEPMRDGLRATDAGQGELIVPGRTDSIRVRVSRREFAGRSIYRHLEEADE